MIQTEDGATTPYGTPRKLGRGRGRGKRFGGSSSQSQTQYLDDDGNVLQVENDEFVLEEDPEGEKKITKLGQLQGGREFRVRCFPVEGRGDRLYMLSTEPARCMGFRDSYLLFQKHRKLYKLVISEREKFELIDRDLIPHSYKGRSIGLVTARSIFREFGARIINNGKYVTDDYYEQAAKDAGYKEGQAAEPEDRVLGDLYNKTQQHVSWHGGVPTTQHHPGAIAPAPVRELLFKDPTSSHAKKRKILVTDENWKLQHATSASKYNKTLLEKRSRTWSAKGEYEPHTGIPFYPQASQPLIAAWKRNPTVPATPTSQVIVETTVTLPNQAIRTGLLNVDPTVFETASPEIKSAILEQQKYEKQWQQLV